MILSERSERSERSDLFRNFDGPKFSSLCQKVTPRARARSARSSNTHALHRADQSKKWSKTFQLVPKIDATFLTHYKGQTREKMVQNFSACVRKGRHFSHTLLRNFYVIHKIQMLLDPKLARSAPSSKVRWCVSPLVLWTPIKFYFSKPQHFFGRF